ncbi:RICIN domain-containing protein [Parahaliea aestuarii]|uniref:RICIN domain-containing protein n=1 Tax=Parahaliea aestuarii TaxID=1852021 RepID=A0A5C8ZLJ6_9GAMM|nr:RICIN domain-containing protein [Parahaliea aestuarii]TXS89328.1 RICIN domain-containing protein [Parahaliea aestuarii]
MKYRFLIPGLLALCTAGAYAIDLNTDALKKMQEEGHKIVEDEGKFRTFALPNGQCMQAAGDPSKAGVNVVMRKCEGGANNQKWQINGQHHLQSHGAMCVAVGGQAQKPGSNVVLKACGGSKDQKWSLDGQGRLKNGFDHCLQANNGNVVTATCSNSPQQKFG